MRKNRPIFVSSRLQAEPEESENIAEWLRLFCDPENVHAHQYKTWVLGMERGLHVQLAASPDWIANATVATEQLSALASERKKQELRINLLEIVVTDLKAQIQKLESLRTKTVPINTLAPEPYELLRPILVAVQPTEGGFEVGWFDANIHTTGENEEEAVANLKSLILDFFDSFSREPTEKLGPEPKRQLAVIKQFVKRTP